MSILKLFLILFMLWGFQETNSQTQYYVSTKGNDSKTGTSLVDAWGTIQHAMDEASPNSVVNILAGTYPEKVEVNVSGSIGNPIVFTSYNQDEVILDGSGITSLEAIIGIFDQSYVHIQNLVLRNSIQLDAQGIIVEGNCQGIEIRNNEIHDIHFSFNPADPVNAGTNSQPLIVYGTNGTQAINDLVISGNIIHDSRTGFSEGLAINGNIDGFMVEDNILYNISNIGIDIIGHEGNAPMNDQARNGVIVNNTVSNCKSPYATAAGIYVDGGKDLVIERNTVYNCQWGIEIGCENLGKTTSNVIVRSNFIYTNDDAGLAIGGYNFPANSGKVINSQIYNNTLYGNDQSDSGVGGIAAELNLTYTENCTIENNLIYATNSSGPMLYQDDVNSQNLKLDYNLYYPDAGMEYDYEGTTYSSLSQFQISTQQDSHSLSTNPILENPGGDDFHLTSTSPALNSGNPDYLNQIGLDIDGKTRVLDGRIDIGADEFFQTTNAHIIAGLLDLTIYPNPFNDRLYIEGELADYTIHLLDTTGTTVQNLSGSTNPLEVDLDLGAGLYFIRIQHKQMPLLEIQKIVKE